MLTKLKLALLIAAPLVAGATTYAIAKLSVKKSAAKLANPSQISTQTAMPALRALLISRGLRVRIATIPATKA